MDLNKVIFQGQISTKLCVNNHRILFLTVWAAMICITSNTKCVYFVKREKWEAREPISKPKKLKLPVSKIIIHKTNSPPCYETEECYYRVKKLQKFHMRKDRLKDIKYNFIICYDNRVYEGRGWEFVGEHTEGFNEDSIGVAFLCKYSDRPPDEEEIQAVKDLILDGLRKGYIAKGFKIIAHEEISDDTICPGLCLLEELKKFCRKINENFDL